MKLLQALSMGAITLWMGAMVGDTIEFYSTTHDPVAIGFGLAFAANGLVAAVVGATGQ
jgi:hypothetical protein